MIIVKGDLSTADSQLFKKALNEVDAYVFIKDINRRYVFANQQTEELFKHSVSSIIGLLDEDLFDLETSTDLRDHDDAVLNHGKIIKEKEVDIIKSTGEERVYLTAKKPIYNQQKLIIGMLGISTDITELNELQKNLEIKASTDTLTGLYNRGFFFELAEKTFSESQRHQNDLSLIMLDIDFFKKINDTYGHPVGDLVLQALSNNIQTMLRKEDSLARVGGEEFAILLPNTSQKSAFFIAEKIRKNIAEISLSGDWQETITPKVSLGVASLLSGHHNFDEIYAHADKALYRAKFTGRNKVCVAE